MILSTVCQGLPDLAAAYSSRISFCNTFQISTLSKDSLPVALTHYPNFMPCPFEIFYIIFAPTRNSSLISPPPSPAAIPMPTAQAKEDT